MDANNSACYNVDNLVDQHYIRFLGLSKGREAGKGGERREDKEVVAVKNWTKYIKLYSGKNRDIDGAWVSADRKSKNSRQNDKLPKTPHRQRGWKALGRHQGQPPRVFQQGAEGLNEFLSVTSSGSPPGNR
jgi:hypothetical protein